MKRICHMTSAHRQNDVRIYLKECKSLAEAGYEVYLVAAGNEHTEKSLHVIGCGDKPDSRRERMMNFTRKIYEKALSLDCDIYHLHDPELLPYGIKLKKLGKKVIFDSHEDVSGQIMSKYWIPIPIRWIISKAYYFYESYVIRNFDAVITATPHIATLFEGRNRLVEVVNNYPKLDDIIFHNNSFSNREKIICFAGGINAIRGERVMVEAVQGLDDIKLILAGPRDEGGEKYVRENVLYTGRFTHSEVNSLYGRSRVGLIIYQPVPNHIKSKPNKIFEYMAAGLPIVCSNFPLWREIIENSGCGICVDPTSPQAVREACLYLINNPQIAQVMGKRGYEEVATNYNWKSEEHKLLKVYEKVMI